MHDEAAITSADSRLFQMTPFSYGGSYSGGLVFASPLIPLFISPRVALYPHSGPAIEAVPWSHKAIGSKKERRGDKKTNKPHFQTRESLTPRDVDRAGREVQRGLWTPGLTGVVRAGDQSWAMRLRDSRCLIPILAATSGRRSGRRKS